MPGLEYLSPKLRHLSTGVYERILRATATDLENDINVLTHGDLWSNNIMFRCQQQEAVLIDFQSAYVGAPILDVIYAFYTSSADGVTANDWDTLMQHYWNEFSDVLKKLEFSAKPIPSLSELQADRTRRTHHALAIGLYALAVRNVKEVVADEQAKMVMDTEANRAHRIRMMLNPSIRGTLEKWLKFYDSNGFFD